MIELQDRQNRKVRYLRLSVTDRCNLRCRYCMPEKMTFFPRADVLTFEEIQRLVKVFVSEGIQKIRLTGGEPLARKDIVKLVEMIATTPGVEDLAMTTNAVLLAPLAQSLVNAGLQRINVSCDTFDPERFKQITRWGDVEPVVAGIEAAQRVGLDPVKINAVLVRGVNDDHPGQLIRDSASRGCLLRFIEYMPIGIDDYWQRDRFVPVNAIRAKLNEQGYSLTPLVGDGPVGGGPATYWQVTFPEGGPPVTVGFIAALTHNFCAQCNRVRLTADGRVRECLAEGGRLSLRDMLRNGDSDKMIADAIHQALYGKVDGHGFMPGSGGIRTRVPMSALGG